MQHLTVSADSAVTTVISTFTVHDGKQQDLLSLLSTNAAWLSKLPGFIGAAFHPSADGTRIVNYAQWESEDALQTMLSNPAMAEHRMQVGAIASVEATRYTVDSVHLGSTTAVPQS
jgi:quinol monooxygenase YgiN